MVNQIIITLRKELLIQKNIIKIMEITLRDIEDEVQREFDISETFKVKTVQTGLRQRNLLSLCPSNMVL